MGSEYLRLREDLFAKSKLHDDPDFLPIKSSLWSGESSKTLGKNIKWCRPTEICENAEFLIDDIDRFEVYPSSHFPKSPLVSILAIVVQYRGLFYRAVPADQGFTIAHNYAGILHFRLFWQNEWLEVIIDDKLPYINDESVGVYGSKNPELSLFWAQALHKALAKLFGSYELVDYATADELANILTGGTTETINLSRTCPTQEHLVYLLDSMANMQTIITAVTDTIKSTNNLYNAHPSCHYVVLGVEETDDRVKLVRLRNTPGTGMKALTGEFTSSLGDTEHVWLTLSEFLTLFIRLNCIHFDPDTCASEPRLRHGRQHFVRSLNGVWMKSATAGGCSKIKETHHLNMQYSVTITSPATTVIVALQQLRQRHPHTIGWAIYRVTGDCVGKRLTKKALSKKTDVSLVKNSAYSNQVTVTERIVLNEGHYVLISSTYDSDQEAKFFVTVFTRTHVNFCNLDDSLHVENDLTTDQQIDEKYLALFQSFADDSATVDAFALQELLYVCLPNDFTMSAASQAVCRRAVACFRTQSSDHHDVNYVDDRMSSGQFGTLVSTLKLWQTTFSHYSTSESSGVLRGCRLRDALMACGIRISTEILMYVHRAHLRRDGTLRFGDFVGIALHLVAVFYAFEKRRKVPTNESAVQMTAVQWMQFAMQCS